MDSSGSPIELDEDVLFIESEWIGQNKKYANAPDFVRWQKEKNSDMEIPLDILQFANFPKPEFSVNDFLALNFPVFHQRSSPIMLRVGSAMLGNFAR